MESRAPRPASTLWYRAAQVRLEDHDPSWPGRYADEARMLTDVLAPHLVAIEHVGSTSIPGMAAKPVIDILVAVPDYSRFEELVRCLAGVGYVYTPESEADDPDRRVFRKGPADVSRLRTHHLHLTRSGSRYWNRMVAFRDYLRLHPEDAVAYADLKRSLVAEYGKDPASYTAGKHRFVTAVEQKAAHDAITLL